MSEEIEIQKMNTSCKGCFFSIWYEKLQTGCQLGLIQSFKDRNAVVEVYDEVGDEFYVINGKYCQYKRSPKWAEPVKLYDDLMAEKVRKEVQPKVELLIYIDKQTPREFNKLEKTLKSASLLQGVGISGVALVNNSLDNPDNLSARFKEILTKYKLDKISWKIKHVIEAEANYNRCCDLIIKESKFPYFLICPVGFKIAPDILTKIDRKLNEDFEPFSIIKFNQLAYLGQTFLYRLVGGNNDRPFLDKIKDAAENQNLQEMIINV